jgi:ribonuclease HII
VRGDFRSNAPAQRTPRRPSYEFERQLALRGFVAIAGLDEVGRGTLAGPVVAAAVVLPPPERVLKGAKSWPVFIRDSKQLSAGQREEGYEWLVENCVSYGTGACGPDEIDRIGIVAATRLAMARALDLLEPQPDHLLIDALELPSVSLPQTPIIKGDAVCLSIASASIIAKVTRDRLMETVFEPEFPGYGFGAHKGYGTAEHMDALRRLGPCPIHRMTFAPVRDLL